MEDKYSSLQNWMFDQAFTDNPWFAPAHETETLTRALQISLSTDANYPDVFAAGSSSSPVLVDTAANSDTESEPAPRWTQSPALSPPAGKVSKRNPRPSKRSTTTFIYADLANFHQMVQQLTGIPPGAGRTHAAAEAVLRPEPRRTGKWTAMEGGFPSTLDTSAFLLERTGGAALAGSVAAPSSGSQTFFGSGPGGSAFDIDPPLPCFPTLDSWGHVMM